VWENLQRKKEKCLKQKARIEKMKIIPNYVSKLLDLFFKTVACEINKMSYLKDMSACFFAFKNNKSEYEYGIDVKQVDFSALETDFTDLQSMDEEEILFKFETLQLSCDSFFDDFELKMGSSSEKLPPVSNFTSKLGLT
jgi:hypothetical protein